MKKQNRQRKQNRVFVAKLGRYDNIPSTTELFLLLYRISLEEKVQEILKKNEEAKPTTKTE